MRPASKLFLGSAAGALNTLNAYRPLGATLPVATTATMPASLVTSEFPLQAIAAQQLAALTLASRGASQGRSHVHRPTPPYRP